MCKILLWFTNGLQFAHIEVKRKALQRRYYDDQLGDYLLLEIEHKHQTNKPIRC